MSARRSVMRLIAPPVDRWHAIVVIPARDEAERIARCLRLLRRAAAVAGSMTTVDIVVVADACRDDTADRARRALGALGVVHVADVGSAGAARRCGVELGLARSTHPVERTWIANTDADTAVPIGWLRTQLVHARAGADAVAGVVRLGRGRDRTSTIQRAFDATYLLRPDGSHHHVHGANLGVRADSYLAVGGWTTVETGEDVDLWRRLGEAHVVVSASTSFVRTSARRIGRAPAGFAADLVALDADLRPELEGGIAAAG